MTITDEQFESMACRELEKVLDLFIVKNEQYGSSEDVLSAFKESAYRQYGEITKKGTFKSCMQLKDKHDLALLRYGTLLPDAKERLKDIIVYSLLGLAILSNEDTTLQG